MRQRERRSAGLSQCGRFRQLATKAENRLIKWGIGLALGQLAIIAALVKIL